MLIRHAGRSSHELPQLSGELTDFRRRHAVGRIGTAAVATTGDDETGQVGAEISGPMMAEGERSPHVGERLAKLVGRRDQPIRPVDQGRRPPDVIQPVHRLTAA